MRRKESRINQLGRYWRKPDVTIHKVGNHQVLTFTFEQDGHKYMVGIYNQGGIDMVEIHE